MSITRRAVLKQLAAESGVKRPKTTTVTLAAALNADEQAVASHIAGLAACELARIYPDGRVRITITGEELLKLGLDELVIVESR